MTLALSKAATCRSNTAGRREITVGLLHWPPISSAGRLQSLLPSAVMLLRLQPRPQPPADLGGVDILSGAEALSLYRFNTGTAKHFFCSKCGIYTHRQRRSNPNEYGVNVACLSGLSPFDFEDVVVYDGANHPEDAYSRKPRVAGHLKFISMREAAMAGGTKVD